MPRPYLKMYPLSRDKRDFCHALEHGRHPRGVGPVAGRTIEDFSADAQLARGHACIAIAARFAAAAEEFAAAHKDVKLTGRERKRCKSIEHQAKAYVREMVAWADAL